MCAECGNVSAVRARRLGVSRAVRSLVIFVLAATVVAGMTAGCASSPAPTMAGVAQFVGFRWRIQEIRHGASQVAIPASLRGFVAFARDRTLLASDSVNGYFGHYRVESGDSYRPLNIGSTLVGWSGRDRIRLSLIHAVEALTHAHAVVSADTDGDRLRLSTAGYTITASKMGVAPDQAPPSPTATRS